MEDDAFLKIMNFKTTLPIFGLQLLTLFFRDKSLIWKKSDYKNNPGNLLLFSLYENDIFKYISDFFILYILATQIPIIIMLKQFIFVFIFNRLLLFHVDYDMKGMSFDISGFRSVLYISKSYNLWLFNLLYDILDFNKPSIYNISFIFGSLIYYLSFYSNLVLLTFLAYILCYSDVNNILNNIKNVKLHMATIHKYFYKNTEKKLLNFIDKELKTRKITPNVKPVFTEIKKILNKTEGFNTMNKEKNTNNFEDDFEEELEKEYLISSKEKNNFEDDFEEELEKEYLISSKEKNNFEDDSEDYLEK
jgi:hypothetical protein